MIDIKEFRYNGNGGACIGSNALILNEKSKKKVCEQFEKWKDKYKPKIISVNIEDIYCSEMNSYNGWIINVLYEGD